MRINGRFNGPAGSANGGIASGRLASYVGASAVEVTLRRPPPLDRDLRVDAAGGSARLYDGDLLVAEAVPSTVELEVPAPVPLEQARAAEATYGGLVAHPFPTCFSCGTERTDGLGLRPGMVGEGRAACTWAPADEDPVLVWAALDCPGGWASDLPGRPMVLGRMALQQPGRVVPGQPHVISAWITAEDGRKTHTATALHGPDGALVAVARATWLALA
ncbi:MAG: hypothetical protein JWM62_2172 [Frankiales bacterium]|jgi:hypothetical protein|nr:hypothetical protein [Frankiales bacterium]